MTAGDNSRHQVSRQRLLSLLTKYFIPIWVVAMFFLAYLATSSAMGGAPSRFLEVLRYSRFFELLLFSGFVLLFFFVVATLPLMMILGYQGTQVQLLVNKLSEDLLLCGLDGQQLEDKVKEYEERNSLDAFFLPMLVNLLFMWLMWLLFIFPTGMEQLVKKLLDPDYGISLHSGMRVVTQLLSPVVWAFLGAYFYTLMVLLRRWIQADVTTNLLWKLNVRIAVAIIIGLLLLQAESSPRISLPHVIAFLAGIVPDTVLHWLIQQMKGLSFLPGKVEQGLLKPSNLQQNIDGLNFWQIDRLFEESIESVQDLAMKEIPYLLMRTRFDTPLLIHWVDQALLCNQVGNEVTRFKAASINTASNLLDMVNNEHQGVEGVLKSMREIQTKPSPTELTPAVLRNIIGGLNNGPNLCYVCEYWRNTSTIEARKERLRRHELESRAMKTVP